ncbi:hypothetical protein UES5b_049 [Escherichia phage UE-S5b]
MANATVKSKNQYSIAIDGLSEEDLLILASFMQNSPFGYSPHEEPEKERELRKVIFEACKSALDS